MKKVIFISALLLLILLIFNTQLVLADHVGDYYDNRDGDHARMDVTPHTGLTYMSSGYGAQSSVIPDKVVFGNASLAVVSGIYWGSMVRYYHMRSQSGMDNAYDLYVNNNAYWYPEHRDHDDVDYYFSQTPTANNSQGSSGTEIDEMHKWFYTLNAFEVDTKSSLVNNKLIAPTMQMIARRSRAVDDTEYLTGTVHPNAFDNADNQDEMIAMATAMDADKIPPMVQISVVEEDYNLANDPANFFEPSHISKENMHNTPVSITRVFHGNQYAKRLVVTAEESYDANGLPLTYYWSVLRGDEEQIRINSLVGDNSRVEILIDYHPETNVEGETILTNLVSVGAFVHNGYYYSAPAFVTSYTKRNEERAYNDVTKKIESITYDNDYVDPYISQEKEWGSDTFSYDVDGNLSGWTRLQGTEESEFTKEGYVVEETDSEGNPILVSRVYYSTSDGKTTWQRIGQPFNYPDEIAPILAEVIPIPTPTDDNTPDYTFSSNEAGTIIYGGDCTGTTINATEGNNTITFISLEDGTYSNCTITVTDAAGNTSDDLVITTFTVDTSSPTVRADVDQDGEITTIDAQLTLRNSLGLSMDGTDWEESDITGDANCLDGSNSTDAMLIMRYSLGLSMDETGWCG